MKSQYYRQIQFDTQPRNSLSKVKYSKKKNSNSTVQNLSNFSKKLRQQKVEKIHSIRQMTRPRKQSQFMISYSKPLLQIHQQSEQRANCNKICHFCEKTYQQKQKEVKLIKMGHEQELTSQKQKYINMERKYLLKQTQFIKLMSEYDHLMHLYEKNMIERQRITGQWSYMKENQQKLEDQIQKIRQELKLSNQKSSNFRHFLQLLKDQTKAMISWAKSLEKIQQQLPPLIYMIKEAILDRKFDLQVTLKEATTFQKLNFSEIECHSSQQKNGFLGDESQSQSFMKYLKPQSTQSNSKNTKNTKTTNFKNRYSVMQANNCKENKQNINFSNGFSCQTYINSKIKQVKTKPKYDSTSDQFFRMLLLQAQTIQSSKDLRYDSIKSNSLIEFQDIKICQSEDISIAPQ